MEMGAVHETENAIKTVPFGKKEAHIIRIDDLFSSAGLEKHGSG